MNKPALTGLGVAAAFALAISTAAAYPGQQLAQQATITLAQAQAIALRAVPNGKIASSELEKEKGGSGLRYTFDIKAGGKVREVGVDAKTGKILENAVEGKNPD